MTFIDGGVCAAKGFRAAGVHCGIRKNRDKKDLALIVSDSPASAASVYTTNLVKGAPIAVTQKNLQNGLARAIVCNSGNANTCNAGGEEIAEGMCVLAADALKIDPKDVIVASTGVIGQPLSLEPIAGGMGALVGALGDNSGDAAEAIMTTDTLKKEFAVSFALDGKICSLGGIAKGSGMIHPNMATMLAFITTDAAISPKMLKKALDETVADTFNMISVDGDTSTNDMVSVLANAGAQNTVIDRGGEDFETFKAALFAVMAALCRAIAKDGEGATKLLECQVDGAKDQTAARLAARGVISSTLFKAAMFGADANWGRVLCAIGYSGADADMKKVDVAFESRAGAVEVCKMGEGTAFSEEKAKTVLGEDEIVIKIGLNSGGASATAWGCDLTYDYVKINGDYRT